MTRIAYPIFHGWMTWAASPYPLAAGFVEPVIFVTDCGDYQPGIAACGEYQPGITAGHDWPEEEEVCQTS